MRITTVISKDIVKNKVFRHEKIQMLNFIVLGLALISGTLMYIFVREHIENEIESSFTRFLTHFVTGTKVEIFTGMLISNIPYIIMMIILSKSSVGYILGLIISFIKASGVGVMSAFMYSCYGLKGIEYSFIIFFPGKILLIFSMLCLMYICVNSSCSIRQLTKGEDSRQYDNDTYISKFVLSCFLFVLTALIECFFISSFSSLFVF